MKIVFAIDSFKGCMSSIEANNFAAIGVKRVYPNAEFVKIPVADGGEGTLETFAKIKGAKKIVARVKNPTGDLVVAKYVLYKDDGISCAMIESAQAIGLTLLKKLQPMKACSFGLGELILHAYKKGARKFLIGLGGSATTDGGMGMLSALGAKFFDKNGKLLTNFGGENLKKVSLVDFSDVSTSIKNCEFKILCDVKNKLCGKLGAANVFSAQKGASPKQIKMLDCGLKSYAKIIEKSLRCNASMLEGAGSAGGIGFALMAVLNAKKVNGIDCVLDSLDFSKKIADADFVITGEGCIDFQSSMGKTPSGVALRAKEFGIPVIAVCGKLAEGYEALYKSGVSAIFCISQKPMSIVDAMKKQVAKRNMSACCESIFRLISTTKSL